MYDVLIIGAGPAGLSAAVYAARGSLKTLVLGILKNSNAHKAHIIENYFGFENRISGPFLMEQGKKQALRFGAELVESEVVDVRPRTEEGFMITDSERTRYEAKMIIICSGIGFKPSGIKNEALLLGKGVSTCVTCDGFFFKEKRVCVIGSADFVAEEALELHNYTPHITILSHGKSFSFSPVMQMALEKAGIVLRETPRLTEFVGTDRLEKLRAVDGQEFLFTGAFLALGNATAGDFANKLGVLRTGPQNAFLAADPRTGETNVPGVYAAGDCTGGNAQAAKSAGEGCNAAISVIKKLKGVAAYVDYD